MAAASEWRQADARDRERYWWAGAAPAPGSAAGPTPSPALPEDSHYAVLGLAPSATPAEVRRAYLRRVAAAHPDKGGDRAAFDAVQAAFAVLSDSTERLIYDEQLQRRLARSGGFGAAATTSGGDGTSGRSCHSRQGVTVVVHGQTQGSPPAQQPCKAQHASTAGQRAGCGSAELQAATAEIQRLQGGGGGGGASAAAHAANLAAAHLQRAALHKAAGQLHHARFDAEEALRLAPGSSRAAVLVAELEAAAAEEQASRGRGAGSAASDSDDSEF